MARPTISCLILAATGFATLPAVEINQTLYGEVLVEGIFQNNYTDANGRSYVRTDPLVYSNLGQLSTVNGQQFASGDFDDQGMFRGLAIDPATKRLLVRDQDRRTYYQDSSSQMWIRAKLGAKIQIEDRVEANIAVVYDAEGGDRTHFGEPGATRGGVYLNDANVLLRRVFLEDLHLRVGRQPVSWNLRRGHGAFLHDSRSNNPTVTSWDGVRAHYNFENFTFSPYHFILDAAREERGLNVPGDGLVTGKAASKDNTLSGLHIDWQPEGLGENRLFLTGAVNIERNVVVQEANPITNRPQLVGDNLWNYYAGMELSFSGGLTLWAEGAIQDGDLDQYQSFGGHGVSAGIEWDVGGRNNAIIGLQFDHRTGDRQAANSIRNMALNPDSFVSQAMGLSTVDRILLANLQPEDPDNRTYRNFVAPWEGTSDALIVEHERYGQLSNLLVGNLAAIKAKLEYKFDHLDNTRPFHLKFLFAHFIIDTPFYDQVNMSRGANYFGSEFDLSVSWQYNKFTTLNLFGGVFFPGLGYRQVAAQAFPNSVFRPQEVRDYQFVDQAINDGGSALSTYFDALYPNLTDDRPITLLGMNVHVTF